MTTALDKIKLDSIDTIHNIYYVEYTKLMSSNKAM